MKRLSVKNVGPISEIDAVMNRFNFFIGPQSSGKSTIAKIFSTCSWIEKEVATTFNENAIGTASDFVAKIVDFHKMDTYFSEQSEIHFLTNIISIDLAEGKFSIRLLDKDIYRRKKICYIPSERNAVTLPELQGFEFGPTNLRSFLFDWFNAREGYDEGHKAHILDLGVKYYYDANETKYKDRIEHKNGKTYHMPLCSASSGLQSVIPLLVMLQYYSGQYFSTYDEKMSFQTDEKTRRIRRHLVDEIVLKESFPDYDPADRKRFVDMANRQLEEGNPEQRQRMARYTEELKRLTIPVATQFIVEEPEQNLFPDTQLDLMDAFFTLCNGERQHELTVTTHSPYILNQLNLLFKRYDEKDGSRVGADFNEVSVYAVDEGHITDLKLQNAHLVNPEYLSAPLDRIYNQYEAYDKH